MSNRSIIVRSIDPVPGADDAAIASLFRDTLMLGRPIPFALDRADRYRDLCLRWYLTVGRSDAGVALDDTGRIAGYALVCTDQVHHDRWTSRRAASFVAGTLWQLAIYGMERESRVFYAARARDARELRTVREAPPMPVHAHLNVARTARSGSIAAALRDHIDDRCARQGSVGWWAEMNAPRGRRERALDRLGIEVIRRTENATLTAAMGEPVDRLTIVRRLPTS
jgi:hypothetical protein